MIYPINTDTVKSSGKPLLIHIGYHKTASTWLQKSVFRPSNGFFQPFELCELYECIVSPNALSFDWSEAQRYLEVRLSSMPESDIVPVLSHERFSGDPFTGSRDAKEISNRLHAGFPETKVLIVVREQFELIASLYKTYVLHGGKATLDSFIQPECDEVNQWFDYSTYCYDKLINHYIAIFGRENVLVVAYEELKHDNQRFYDGLCEFMCIPTSPLKSNALVKANVSLSELGTELLRRISLVFGMFCAYPLEVSNNKFWRLARSAIYRLEWINKRISSKGKLNKSTKKILSGKFKESNAALQIYISSDIGRIGYEL